MSLSDYVFDIFSSKYIEKPVIMDGRMLIPEADFDEFTKFTTIDEVAAYFARFKWEKGEMLAFTSRKRKNERSRIKY